MGTRECDWERRKTRIDEAGDAVPGCQDSITRGVRNLQLTDVPTAQPVPAVTAPRTIPNSREPTQQRPRHQRALLHCAQCGADPHAYTGHTDGGLMEHMRHKHGSQTLTQESVAQLRQLDRAAFVICGSIWSRPGNRYTHCRAHTATGDSRGKYFPRSAPPRLHQPPIGSQPIPQGEHQTAPFETLSSLNVTHSCLATFIASAMAIPRSIVSRCATGWAESLEGALKGHQSWDILWRHWLRILLAEVPKGPDRNSEIQKKTPTAVGSRKSARSHWKNSGSAAHWATGEENFLRPQTAEQRGKRACALTARGSISKALKGLVGGAAAGSAEHRMHWTTALISGAPGEVRTPQAQNGLQQREQPGVEADTREARNALKEQGRSKTGIESLGHVKLAPMRAPGPLSDMNIWMPSLPSQAVDSEDGSSESQIS